ncbi:reverse transcriptase domain-containing protein [Tanacetum coccineum]
MLATRQGMSPVEIDQIVVRQGTILARNANNKRKWGSDHGRNPGQQQNKRRGVVRACAVGPGNKKTYAKILPYYNKCFRCCNESESLSGKSKATIIYYECGSQGHYKRECSKLKNQNYDDQKGIGGKAHEDPNIIKDNGYVPVTALYGSGSYDVAGVLGMAGEYEVQNVVRCIIIGSGSEPIFGSEIEGMDPEATVANDWLINSWQRTRGGWQPPAGPPPQNHNGPPRLNLQMPTPDLRTMEELLKNHMIQQVQNSCQFHGLLSDDANKHLDKFLTITQSMKQNGVSNDALHLYLFLYSLTHHATTWFDRLPKNSIHTFQEMAMKFLSKYFPPSMVTKLRNDISNF